jgi:A/G-specific adenine glycosylase
MLQQTQVDRVVPKYREWLRRFPTLKALAAAEPREARRLWYPLGYNARPLRLHAIAREAVARWNGRLPDRADALDALPGVGQYTASAVASIAYGARLPAVDTNVRRVLSRVLAGGRPLPPRRLWDAAAALVPADRPGDFNQALMDLGATVCRPRAPACPRCPVRRRCRYAARSGSARGSS